MANEIKLPKETLMKLGFKTLDLMYGELTIKKGKDWDKVFVDKNSVGRLGYDNPGKGRQGLLGYLYNDEDFFLRIIPVKEFQYLWVLRTWIEERYKRRVVGTSIRLTGGVGHFE